MTSPQVRNGLVLALRLDLVGPEPGSGLDTEVLPQAPSRRYLTGFLVPYEAPVEARMDDTGGAAGAALATDNAPVDLVRGKNFDWAEQRLDARLASCHAQ